MTRYEKYKEGMAFLFGDDSVETVEKAADLALDFLDCWHCPCYEACESRARLAKGDSSALKECRELLLSHLLEEAE